MPAAPRGAPARFQRRGSTVSVMKRRRKVPIRRSMARPRRLPLRWVQPRKGHLPVPGFFEAVCNRAAFQPPFAQEGLETVFDFGCCIRIDHVAAILGEFVLHTFRGLAKQIAMLGNRAALEAASTMTISGRFRPLASRYLRN